MGQRFRSGDERTTVRAAAGGSSQARGQLFDDHWDAAWRRAAALLGDPVAAEDVVQDAFERAFRGLHRFEAAASFRTWLLRIVTNRAIDVMRVRHRDRPLDETLAEEPVWPDDPGRRGSLRRAVSALSPERRAVVVLVYWLDLTVAEAAHTLDIPEGTAKSRLSRGLDELRDALGATDVR